MDVDSFKYLEPIADGFLNWTHPHYNREDHKLDRIAEHLMVERSALLGLTIPEMVALLIGFRALSLHHRGSDISSQSWNRRTGHKVNRDFLENALLKQWYKWTGGEDEETPWWFAGQHLASETNIKASRTDMFIASNSILRSVAEVYGGEDGDEVLISNFIQAWDKVMMLDRFDVRK